MQINSGREDYPKKAELKNLTAPTIVAILVAAGAGRRFGADKNKVLLPLLGKPVIEWSLEKLEACPQVTDIVVVTAECDLEEVAKITSPYKKVRGITTGGDCRQESVFRGILYAGVACDLVLIHDAARPILPAELIPELITMVDDTCQGAMLAVPVHDTIKEAVFESGDCRVVSTLDRDKLFAAQTPQVFVRRTLLSVHECAKRESYLATDDAQLLEHYGYGVKILVGNSENIKITTAPDMLWAELLLKRGSDTL